MPAAAAGTAGSHELTKRLTELIRPADNNSSRADIPLNDIDTIVRTSTQGFNLQEVKVAFNHDVKIDVSGVRVDGKRGDILNLPRWVANVLESEKHAEIQDTDMVVELKQAIVKENVQGEFELATLEPHFYIKLRAYTRRLSESDGDKVGSMLNSLVRKRQGKIVRLADSSRLTADLSQKLTVEEQAFYEAIYENSRSFKEKILGADDDGGDGSGSNGGNGNNDDGSGKGSSGGGGTDE